ncbi:hypothetical protein Vqi01_39360 [Micromonospora qiuiae]|uniref:Major facilitator superfamily (MFS) profile domain-containing protein n=2 Tax=Micromonospora qiuiae TaxID=502268 RepID=A0ABQ4JEY1_9ACTN|nr:hypothetical protein Vqi01_39360 [Micromonospora qiuiae]
MLLLAVSSVNAAYTVLIPLVPQIERDAGLDKAGIALMFAVYAGAKAVAQPFGGLWVDRWRTGQVALLSLLLIALCVYLLAIARTPLAVLAARTAWGVGAGLLTPTLYQGVTELCVRYAVPTKRVMAWFGGAAVTGLLLGPAFAGLAVGFGLYWLCLICAVVTVGTGFGVHAALREPTAAAVPAEAGTAPAAEPLPRRVWLGTVVLFGVLDLFTNLAYSALEPTIPLYLRDAGQISLVFVLGMATFAVVSWQLGRSRGGPRPAGLILLGCAIGAAGFAVLSFGDSVWAVAPGMVVIMVSQPMLYLAARWGTAELRETGRPMGLAFGIFGAISDFGYMLGPLLGVFLFDRLGPPGFTVVGLVGALGLLCIGPVRRWERRAAAADDRCPAPRRAEVRTAALVSHASRSAGTIEHGP